MQPLIGELKSHLKSELRFDHISKALYSTDASMYQVEPAAVFLPRTKGELVTAIQLSCKHQVPVTARGAATGVAGGCLGKGLVIDCSKYLNRIVEINYAERYAVVQPGVVLDQLNNHIAPHGLVVGPEISTSNRATLGGMAATNAAGAHSLRYGTMKDHLLEVELILYSGEIVRFKKLNQEEKKEKLALAGIEGKIYRDLERIKKGFTGKLPQVVRRSSGYAIEAILNEESINLAELIAGSEGTLGVISELKISLSPKESHEVVVLGFADMQQGLEKIEELLSYHPVALEMVDDKIITAGKSHPSMRSKLDWLEGSPEALIIVACTKGAEALVQKAASWQGILFAKLLSDLAVQQQVWDLRKSGLGLLLSKRSYSRASAFIEDCTVPPSAVATFIKKLKPLLKNHNKEAGIYGHIGDGCLHIRPYFDLQKPQELQQMQQMMHEVMHLVQDCGGVLSGEHGDGLVRSWTTETMFGKEIYDAFCQIKHAFDPYNLMNPGKIVQPSQELTENLRLSPTAHTNPFNSYFDFSKEGGFALAVDMCNGNGACRKKEGIMCPSFQVTHDERDSTRGRANALRDLIHGKQGEKELFDDEFKRVLELCIECKGCKTECPSQVDMAKMKSEFLYHFHKKKRRPLRDYLFGHIRTLFSWGSHVSWLTRVSQNFWLTRKALEYLGISSDRSLPLPATRPFSSLFAKHPKKTDSKQVVLFVDTFNEFISPEVSMDAVKLLEALGFSVIAPQFGCCGRTLISKGFLPEAKKSLATLIDQLYGYAKEGISIVGLEPSCLLTFRDEATALHLDAEKTACVAKASLLIDEFLVEYKEDLGKLCNPFHGTLLVHGHCHQKALVGMQAQAALLREICHGTVVEIASGCCGMAGSFGYEKEHEALSHKIGELVLVPTIQAAGSNAIVITSGTSCRSQIKDLTGISAKHIVQFLHEQLKQK
jgi:FAD/FMN-containing dehydrogenase/Fe-S oxidoreductase